MRMLSTPAPTVPHDQYNFLRQRVVTPPCPVLGSQAPDYQETGIYPPQAKKRRTDRACDACRRKKTRCDGPWAVSNVCSNCMQTRKPCTYLEASKPRGPPKAYVTGLEDRVEKLEELLAQIRPNVDFSEELGPPVIRDSWKNPEDRAHRSHSDGKRNSASRSISPSTTPQLAPSLDTSTPALTSLPPLLIPFHSHSKVAGIGEPYLPPRTTHLIFSSHHKLKKRKSKAGSEVTASSSTSSTKATTGAEYRSSSPFASSSESESSSSDGGTTSGSEEIFVTSISGRGRFNLEMNEMPLAERNQILFHGRSSTAGLVEDTRKFKHMHMQETMAMNVTTDEDHKVEGEPASSEKKVRIKVEGPDNSKVAVTRRPQYWQTPPWELLYGSRYAEPPLNATSGILSCFPPSDLCQTLIHLYFLHSNNHFPLLHRPTFERQWKERLYEHNAWFSCLCLQLFAVASRWCDDTRVLDDPIKEDQQDAKCPIVEDTSGLDASATTDNGQSKDQQPISKEIDWSRAGWKYYEAGLAIHGTQPGLLQSATLFEVQTFTLMGMFLRGTKTFPAAWLMVSIGLRKAQDVGAHRKSIYREAPNVDDELWKRAFWHLVVFDRLGGALMGRSVGIGEEDFDTDLPLEVDDEYWDGPNPWKQPEGVPSQVSAFNQFIKLSQIIAFTTRSVYAIDKSKIFHGLMKGDWRSDVLAQLNRATEEWMKGVPDHLKWSEKITNPLFFTQSAMLNTTYHLARLLIYRPFIPTPPLFPGSHDHDRRETPPPSPIPYPALAICIASARACTRIVEVQLQKRCPESVYIPNFVNSAFIAGALLSLALWDLKGQQKVLIKVKSAGIINSDRETSGEGDNDNSNAKDVDAQNATSELVFTTLKQKMDELVADIKILIDAMEWAKGRWEFVQPLLSRLQDSLPTKEDLQCDSDLARQGEVGKQEETFQDLRRQRQLQQKQRKSGSHPASECDPTPQNPSLAGSWSNELVYPLKSASQSLQHRASHPFLPGRGGTQIIANAIHPRSTSIPLTYVTEHRPDPPDAARFIQEHYPELHTFADDEFDELHESNIRLPTVNYAVPSDVRHHQGQAFSFHSQSSGVPAACSCSNCLSPPLPSSHPASDNVTSQHYQPHRGPPQLNPARGFRSTHLGRHEDIPTRHEPAAGSALSMQDSLPVIGHSIRRTSASSLPVTDVSATRGDDRTRNTNTYATGGYNAMPLKARISCSRSTSSLDSFNMDEDRKPPAWVLDYRTEQHPEGRDRGVDRRYSQTVFDSRTLHQSGFTDGSHQRMRHDSWSTSQRSNLGQQQPGSMPLHSPFATPHNQPWNDVPYSNRDHVAFSESHIPPATSPSYSSQSRQSQLYQP